MLEPVTTAAAHAAYAGASQHTNNSADFISSCRKDQYQEEHAFSSFSTRKMLQICASIPSSQVAMFVLFVYFAQAWLRLNAVCVLRCNMSSIMAETLATNVPTMRLLSLHKDSCPARTSLRAGHLYVEVQPCLRVITQILLISSPVSVMHDTNLPSCNRLVPPDRTVVPVSPLSLVEPLGVTSC